MSPKYEDYNPEIYYSDETSMQEPPEEVIIERPSKNASSRRRKVGSYPSKKQDKHSSKENENKVSIAAKTRDVVMSNNFKIVVGLILAAVGAYLLVTFISYIASCFRDQALINNNPLGSLPPVANKGGEAGARLSEFLINEGYGLGAFVIILWVVAMAAKLLVGKPRFKTVNFTIKCLIAFITVSLILGLITIGSDTSVNWGGYHGRYVNEFIIGFIGWWGAAILCLLMIFLFVTICMRDVVKWVLAKKRAMEEIRKAHAAEKAAQKAKEAQIEEMRRREEEQENPPIEGEKEVADNPVSFDEKQENEENTENTDDSGELLPSDNSGRSKEGEFDPFGEYNLEDLKGDGKSESGSETPESEGDEPMLVKVNQIARAEEIETEKKRKSAYRFPSIDLLEERPQKISVNTDEQLENKEKIRKTLMDFGIPIVSIEATVGPTVTLYEIKPDTGQKVSKIKSLVDDISLSLSAIGVRIIAPIPGKGTVGIEVANKSPQIVAMRTLLESKKYQETKASLPLALGSTISNEVYIADLASIPHLLVAGATGQGKSVGLNVIITSLLYKKRPHELKFVLFDPKMVEFNLYAAIEKQYLAKLPDEEDAIITDMNKVVPTLSSLCLEMDNRYKLLKDAEVRKLEEYNKMIKNGELDESLGHRFLPYIVVVVDEFSDLIMVAGKEVEMPIARLAQKARAVGIHVIIATQRPSAQVITGNIKTNFPGRIAFKVSSGIDSKVILDAQGAQQLIGRGDMLSLNNSEMVRVQCAFIDTPEVKAICEHIGSQPYPAEDSPYLLPEPPVVTEGGGGVESSGNLADRDPLYEEIRNYVITSGTASTSNLQRKYAIGYNRAGKIMDQLEADGVVGPSMGGKPRAVLINSI